MVMDVIAKLSGDMEKLKEERLLKNLARYWNQSNCHPQKFWEQDIWTQLEVFLGLGQTSLRQVVKTRKFMRKFLLAVS